MRSDNLDRIGNSIEGQHHVFAIELLYQVGAISAPSPPHSYVTQQGIVIVSVETMEGINGIVLISKLLGFLNYS